MPGPRTAVARVDVHLTPDDIARQLRDDVRTGLTVDPKSLPPKWFYDDRGSALFDEITRLPEYYLTRREREILDTRSAEIADRAAADTLVELGSGTSEKTRILLDAMCARGTLTRFVPFDVSEGVLRGAAHAINETYPDLEVHAVVGDFERHLEQLPGGGRRMIAFLGSTIGNFPGVERHAFVSRLVRTLTDRDSLLIGFDLIKDLGRLRAAYDDPGGVTAEFNRNVLHVLNRELRADFDAEAFEHVAVFDPRERAMEMSLRATADQLVHIAELDLDVSFSSGEAMRTEISAKFSPEQVEAELAAAGATLESWWTDARSDFGLALARREERR